jgi:hypothetical protein
VAGHQVRPLTRARHHAAHPVGLPPARPSLSSHRTRTRCCNSLSCRWRAEMRCS